MRHLLLLAFVCLLSLGWSQTSSDRLNALAAAINSKDAAKLRAAVESQFAASMFAARKVEDWVGRLQSIGNDLAPIQIKATLLDKETVFVAEIETKEGEKLGLRLDLDPKPPHQIVGIRFSANVQGLVEDRQIVPIGDFRDLKELAKKVREANKVPAIGVAIWRNGKIEAAADGVREIGKPDPVTANDRWLVGSIGKSMTSTLIARLIDQGKLDWNSKLGDLLKDIPMRAEYRAVTVEQLMQHRSGVPRDSNFDGATVARIVGKLTQPRAIRAAYVKDILNRLPIGKPGEKTAYSNAGYAILGHLAERVGGKPYEELMADLVFKPIGMTSAIAGMPGAPNQPGAKGQPHGHVPFASGLRPQTLDGPLTYMGAPAGLGIACTVGDLAKYAAWHMRGIAGEKIELKTETVRRLHRPMAKGETYAAGWVIDEKSGPGVFHWHNGSDGTFRSEMAFWPNEKFVAVAIVNSGGEGDPSPSMQAMRAIYRKLFGG